MMPCSPDNEGRPAEALERATEALADYSGSEQAASGLERLFLKLGGYLESARRVEQIRDVDSADVTAWVYASLPDGSTPSLATRHNRRTAARLAFRLLRQLGAVDHDPTLDVVLPPRPSAREARPLTDVEVERGRSASLRTVSETRRPSVWALAEATATSHEIPRVLPRDIDLREGTVWLSGSSNTSARVGQLSDWGIVVLGRRLERLDADQPVAYQGAGQSAAAMQASCSGALGCVLDDAGLRSDAAVKPGSVRAWAGRRIWLATGRVEDAAVALGARTLDTAAAIIGLHWRADP